jgi:hypothetical protein
MSERIAAKKTIKGRAKPKRQDSSDAITKVAYRPTTTDELGNYLTTRKEELQKIHEEYKEKKVELREAVRKYRATGAEADKAEVLNITNKLSTGYFSQGVFQTLHELQYNPTLTRDGIQTVPTYGYLYRDLTFEHHRTTKIPEHVGIVTYPNAYPADWFYKPKVEAPTQNALADLGAKVGPETPQSGGGDESKKQLSSRQIGAIIAARKARRF